MRRPRASYPRLLAPALLEEVRSPVSDTHTPVTIATGIPVFDGHNDTLLDLPMTGRSFFERTETGHIDLPRARAGGLGGGFFAVFVRDPEVAAEMPAAEADEDDTTAIASRISSRYSDPDRLPEPMSLEYAQREALRTVASLFRLEAASAGAAKVVRNAAELRQCLEDGTLAAGPQGV